MTRTRRRILQALADGSHTGPELADQFDISRAAVWNHIEDLRDRGFTIEGGPTGYTLTACPDFGGDAVSLGLAAPFTIQYQPTVTSTNAWARDLAADGASDVVCLADEQTGGRGRLDRSWASPSGGIWASLLIRPPVPPTDVPIYTLGVAVAIVDALAELDVAATIKWPNDVLVEGQKLAGVLTEMEGEADRVSWVILGVGINANIPVTALPENATSLQALVGSVSRRRVTQQFLDRFDTLRSQPETILAAWRDRATTLGQRVRVVTQRETIVGTAVDVEHPGTLLVETDTGVREITAGDCEHLRPA